MRPFQSFEIEIEMSPWLSRVSSPLGGWSNPVSMHCSGLASCFPLMGGGGSALFVRLLWPHVLVLSVPAACLSLFFWDGALVLY